VRFWVSADILCRLQGQPSPWLPEVMVEAVTFVQPCQGHQRALALLPDFILPGCDLQDISYFRTCFLEEVRRPYRKSSLL
jgi:hypothetical protein